MELIRVLIRRVISEKDSIDSVVPLVDDFISFLKATQSKEAAGGILLQKSFYKT